MSTDARPLDFVIWGATGFTGQLATAYLSGCQEPFKSTKIQKDRYASLKWGVAGRSREKLERVLRENGAPSDVPVFVAGSEDVEGIRAFVSQARVVVAMAGPFWRHSTKVVEACIELGTHYVDITGETAWHRALIERLGDKALKNGVCVVSHCGYDSLPSDLGTLRAVQELGRTVGSSTRVRRVRGYHAMLGRGGLSGGSMATGLDEELHPVPLPPGVDRDSPFLLGSPVHVARKEDLNITEALFYPDMKAWGTTFIMEKINTKVVRRSAMLLGYGPSFGYQEVGLAPNEKAARIIQKKMMNIPPAHVRAEMVKKGRLPAPGQGPSPGDRAKTTFKSFVVAEAEDGRKATAVVTGGEPGYEETAKMVIEAAVCLSKQLEHCPGKAGGFLTPAACMGNVLINRLHNAGIRFTSFAGTPAGQSKL
eukprot:TRINITY_DN39202_c0_g1_i1.p1 TRINITY_DN39202_c0_g1~~TRINITY_DN39202_c0_g1_i1.p1  ORF type:complete len:423 (+),score=84.02 TRINITY_DN39202_c0_g1_i1:66-1334(+)